jgi:hypothetical protein
MEILKLAIDILAYYGIRRETVGPLVLAGILFYIFFRRYSAKPINGVKEQVKSINNAVCEMQMHLTGRDGKDWLHNMRISDFGVSNSPMRPNDAGERLLNESGFTKNYEKIKKLVFPIMDNMKTRTLYDAEQNAIKAMDKVSNDPAFDDIKSYIVNKPYEKPPIELIFIVASWVIRDDYAKERKIKK